eukprot:4066438-Prymnesium_polylepis.1
MIGLALVRCRITHVENLVGEAEQLAHKGDHLDVEAAPAVRLPRVHVGVGRPNRLVKHEVLTAQHVGALGEWLRAVAHGAGLESRRDAGEQCGERHRVRWTDLSPRRSGTPPNQVSMK